jgi:hypothetical protein
VSGFISDLLNSFGKKNSSAPTSSAASPAISAYLFEAKAGVSYPPPNGDAGMWNYEVTAKKEDASGYLIAIKQVGKRDRSTYRLPDFGPDQFLDVIRHHIASQPMPAAKGKSRKHKEPAVNGLHAVYHVLLPGSDKQGRPRFCEIAMANSPLCLGHEGPERPDAAGGYQKTWDEKFVYDARPCHATVCRIVDGRRGARGVSIATEGYGLADAMSAATEADDKLDWR